MRVNGQANMGTHCRPLNLLVHLGNNYSDRQIVFMYSLFNQILPFLKTIGGSHDLINPYKKKMHKGTRHFYVYLVWKTRT